MCERDKREGGEGERGEMSEVLRMSKRDRELSHMQEYDGMVQQFNIITKDTTSVVTGEDKARVEEEALP